MSQSDERQRRELDAARKEAQRVKQMLSKDVHDNPSVSGVKHATRGGKQQSILARTQLADRGVKHSTSHPPYSIFNIPLIRDPPSYSRTVANPCQFDPFFPYILCVRGGPPGAKPQSAPMSDNSHPKVNPEVFPPAPDKGKRVPGRRAFWDDDINTNWDDEFCESSTVVPADLEYSIPEDPRESILSSCLPVHPRIYQLPREISLSSGPIHHNLRIFLTSAPEACTSEMRAKWCAEAAEAVAVLHQHGIMHNEIMPANFLFDEKLELKLSFFHAATTDAEPLVPLLVEERYRHPWASFGMTLHQHDVFALGGVLYFIQTGQDPYANLDSDEVERRYELGSFPDVSGIEIGDTIIDCWSDRISAADAYRRLSSQYAGIEGLFSRAGSSGRVKDAGGTQQTKSRAEGKKKAANRVQKPAKPKAPRKKVESSRRPVKETLNILEEKDAETTN